MYAVRGSGYICPTSVRLAALRMHSQSLNLCMAGAFVLCRVSFTMQQFPQVHMPAKAIAEAKARGVEPDFLYCEALLDATGICTVPGTCR